MPSPRHPGPLAELVAAALTVWLRRQALRVIAVGDGDARARLAELRRRFPGRKVVFFYWQRDVLGLFFLACARGTFGELLREVELACDDTLGGRVTAAVLRRLGGRCRQLRRANLTERVRDLQAIMRSAEPMGIAVDGNGPYGAVGEEFPRLLARCRALVVPVAVASERSIPIRLRARMSLPWPGTRVALGVGETIDAMVSGEDLRARLEAALASAGDGARSRVAPDSPAGAATT